MGYFTSPSLTGSFSTKAINRLKIQCFTGVLAALAMAVAIGRTGRRWYARGLSPTRFPFLIIVGLDLMTKIWEPWNANYLWGWRRKM